MSTIRLIYFPNDIESVRLAKRAALLLAREESNLTAIQNNPIDQENATEFEAELNREVEIIPEWRLGLACVRGRRLRHADIVYRIIQTHIVTDPNATPANTPALYRKAPVIDVGRLFPKWDSIGLLDSENFWLNGDIVDHNGQYWKSNVGANIWEPGAPGITQWDVFNPESGEIEEPGETEPDLCNTTAAWDAGLWGTYTVGTKVKHNGGIYEAKNTTHTWIAPAKTGDGSISWNWIKDC